MGAQLSYDDALAELRRALAFGINPSLSGIEALCAALGRPQDAFEVVQVTGTNGKTSTARFIEALLRAHGRATALYTSPELERYPERMEVAGGVVSDEDFALALAAALDAAETLRPGAQGSEAGFTEFELLTAAALWLFREHGVEIAVLEVGLGGRWDATSVAVPRVAVVTGVGLDHTHILGDTLEAIASEKAAIIRPGSVAVLGPGTADIEPPFLAAAEDAGCDAFAVREADASSPVPERRTVRFELLARPDAPRGCTRLDVAGVHARYAALEVAAPAYQAANVATAIAAAEAALGGALDAAALAGALAGVVLPGRFEIVCERPLVIADGSHNPQAAGVLADAIADAWPDAGGRPGILLGVLADKDAEGIVAALAPAAFAFAVTTPDSPRALPATELARIVTQVTGVEPVVFDRMEDAIPALMGVLAVHENGLVVTGSLVTAGAVRRLLRDNSATAR